MKLRQIAFALVATLMVATSSFAQCGTIPAAGQLTLRALAAKFPEQIRSQNDDERRAWALKAAQQLAFSVSPAYGTKRAGDGRPTTKDSVSRVINGRLCNWDLVNGATRELQFGNGEDITGQVFVPVTPADYLGAGNTGGAEPEPTPKPDPQPQPQMGAATSDLQQQQLAVLLQIVQQLQLQNAALMQGLADLRAQVASGVKIRF